MFNITRIEPAGSSAAFQTGARRSVVAGSCTLAAYHDDARARGTQRLAVPVSVLADDGEALVVQQRRELLREGVAQRGAGDLRALFLALVPALVARHVQDLREVVIGLRVGGAHAPALRV